MCDAENNLKGMGFINLKAGQDKKVFLEAKIYKHY